MLANPYFFRAKCICVVRGFSDECECDAFEARAVANSAPQFLQRAQFNSNR